MFSEACGRIEIPDPITCGCDVDPAVLSGPAGSEHRYRSARGFVPQDEVDRIDHRPAGGQPAAPSAAAALPDGARTA
jgi:hypothetical protein